MPAYLHVERPSACSLASTRTCVVMSPAGPRCGRRRAGSGGGWPRPVTRSRFRHMHALFWVALNQEVGQTRLKASPIACLFRVLRPEPPIGPSDGSSSQSAMQIVAAASSGLQRPPAASARRRGLQRLQAAQPAAAETAEEGSKPLRVSMVRCGWAPWQRLRRRRPAVRRQPFSPSAPPTVPLLAQPGVPQEHRGWRGAAGRPVPLRL